MHFFLTRPWGSTINMFISDAPNKDHPGTPRRWLLIFRRIVSAEHGKWPGT